MLAMTFLTNMTCNMTTVKCIMRGCTVTVTVQRFS